MLSKHRQRPFRKVSIYGLTLELSNKFAYRYFTSEKQIKAVLVSATVECIRLPVAHHTSTLTVLSDLRFYSTFATQQNTSAVQYVCSFESAKSGGGTMKEVAYMVKKGWAVTDSFDALEMYSFFPA